MEGKLKFIYATMSGGKSSVLLMEAHKCREHGIPFICIKPTLAKRDGLGNIVSRMGIKRECFDLSTEDNVYNLIVDYVNASMFHGVAAPRYIFIDEAQFLTSDQVDQLAAYADKYGAQIWCYGLRTDFKMKLFPGSMRLFEVADDIEEIKTPCACGRNAVVNARFDEDGTLVTEGEQVATSPDTTYRTLCRSCYHKVKNHEMEL